MGAKTKSCITAEGEERRKDIERLYSIYEKLSETGKIMMMTYSTAISDKELADRQERHSM